MPFFLVINLLFFSSILCHAQHPFAWQLTDRDGLPDMEVYDLFQDQKGYMWIGTDKGVCKYNGQEFHYYRNIHLKSIQQKFVQQRLVLHVHGET